MIVLDASAAVDVFLGFGPAPAIRERIKSEERGESSGVLHVPHLFELEILSTLRRLRFSDHISYYQCLVALEALSDMRLIHYPHADFVQRIWELRDNVTTYDAAYIALAEALDATLVTTDGKLALSSGHRASVELLD